MKRPTAVVTVIVLQFLIGAFFLGTGVFLLGLMIRPEVKPGVDTATAIQGLKVASVILDPFTILIVVSGFALLAGKRWGWWLALVTDLLLTGMFVYSMVDEGWNIDWEMAGFTMMSIIVPILFALTSCEEFLFGEHDCRTTSAFTVSGIGFRRISTAPC